jgi:hypothetical protein
MYVSDCTNVYQDDSEGYPTMLEACQNCFDESITDLGASVGQCYNVSEGFQLFDTKKPMNIVVILLILILLVVGGIVLYKSFGSGKGTKKTV